MSDKRTNTTPPARELKAPDHANPEARSWDHARRRPDAKDFSSLLVAHACAAKPAALTAAEGALVRARAIAPLDIAYKLVAGWSGVDPDQPDLSVSTVQDILASDATNDRKLIASAFLDLYALDADIRAECARQAVAREPWDRAAAALDAVRAEDQRLAARIDEANAAVKAEAPMPETLKRGGKAYRTVFAVMEGASLSFDEKVELVAIVREWQARLDEAEERHGLSEAHDAWEEHRTDAEFDSLMDIPAPDLAAVRYKLRAYLERAHCGMARHDVDTADTISEFLTNPNLDGPWGAARVYQDLLLLTGERSDLVEAQPFDAEAWIDRFTAHPGHEASVYGIAYNEPDAWPDGDMSKEPAGEHLWRGLTEWQKEAVLSWLRSQPNKAA
jgi:hypothetical protein